MTEDDLHPEQHGAELCGLPHRTASSGRDRLEEIASGYLEELRAGRRTDVETIARQHPLLADEIREFLPLVAAMEDWKESQELRSIQRALPEQFQIDELGEYRIIREIARGGMGVVFEAEQPSLSRRVAIKLLPWRIPSSSHWAEQFVREARTAASLQHPHIVPIYSFGEHEERYYYVMQLIEGVGLDRLITRWLEQQGVVEVDDLVRERHPHIPAASSDGARGARVLRHESWQQIGKLAAQLVSALRYAHQRGTLHCDIKPANLLIDRQAKVWIADFGLATARDRVLSDSSTPLAGTMRYMAPEQFRGTAGDERSDLYSVGATLYELCTLRPAFSASTKLQLQRQIQQAEFPRPRTVRREIPAGLERIILKAMSADPDNRQQSADELHRELLQFLSSQQGSGRWWRRLFKSS